MRLASLILLAALPAYPKEIHVRAPQTISSAAAVAQPDDVITVHAGTYRERVTPPRSRVVYQAARGETVVIKGSEVVRGWTPVGGGIWKVTLPNSFFGAYNPYNDLIVGDWFNNKGRPHHTGQVYLNGKSLGENHLPDLSAASDGWYCDSDERNTYISANFGNKDPNQEFVEINVRDSCFYPDRPGVDEITVRGFRMMHAATQWAAPTAEQIGLIGTHWSKGWIIENNVISDSKCVGISLGKDRKTGHNVWINDPKKDGATHYNEVIVRALEAGWSREKIGSHVVRNNVVFNCEQAGIVGSLGAAFSRITGNHIYDIWTRRQFSGAEMAGIKLHGAIDVVIERNRIHNTGRGLWMDWMAQGTRITGNLVYGNTSDDLFVEVDHGPFVVDNNVFLSPVALRDVSEGGAYVHNLWNGGIVSKPEPNRRTPYHKAHSTALAGLAKTTGGDNRFYNNVFTGADAASRLAVYDTREFRSFFGGNVFGGTAEIEEDGDCVYLRISGTASAATQLVTAGLLGRARVPDLPYESTVDRDYFGKKRPARLPMPGPFEEPEARVKVW